MKFDFGIKSFIVLVLLALMSLSGCTVENKGTNPPVVDPDPDPDPEEEPEVWTVTIEKVEDVLQGHFQNVSISMNNRSEPIGGFDFLIGYETEGLAFTEAEISDHLRDCGWEYFTYRYNWNGNCGDDCPSGLIRLVGMADTNNGAVHPDFECIADSTAHDIATMRFYVSNDRTLECQFLPIDFYWIDCGDNTIAVPSGDTLCINRHVFNDADSAIELSDSEFPTYYGAPESCTIGDRYTPVRYVDFYNGGIDIVCADSIQSRGDINLNGIAFEIADAVMLSNYYINGVSAFNNIEASIAASDVNRDGITPAVADFCYLIRIIVGDALPLPLPEPPAEGAQAFILNGNTILNSPVDIGAALFIFHVGGPFPNPVLLVNDMDMKYAINGDELRVFVYNIGSNYIPSGYKNILSVGNMLELTSVEAGTFEGAIIPVTIQVPGAK